MPCLSPQPFVDESHPVHNLFPPMVYAIAIPTALLVVGIAAIFTFIGVTLMRAKKGKPKTA